ncbi:MAG TPA: YIEGIA domain-containing protein [Clostridia bacterium]
METGSILHASTIIIISAGIFTGTLARIITLKIDYRQYPSYPNGYFIHIVAGFIASALGAIAIPALIEKDFAAFTFLALAIEHFRDIRRIEAESLEKLEDTEYTTRGTAYIDGIAKTFEARNYISLLSSLTTVFTMIMFHIDNIVLNIITGIASGMIVLFVLKSATKGKKVGDICTVRPGQIQVSGSELFVDGIFVTNLLGTDKSRNLFINEGIAVLIEPQEDIFRITLENYGQRQAILFEALRTFGVKRYHFTKRSFSTGKIIIAFVPVIHDIEKLLEVIKQTPILENSRKVRKIIKNPVIGGR